MKGTMSYDVFRKVYTPLSPLQMAEVEECKEEAQRLLDLFNKYVPSEERSERSRCMAIAKTNLEQTIMWAVKAITTSGEVAPEKK